ncbi:transaldolase/glucose-6-phosphate isomerase [Thermosporothrix hazakensis]|jgi:glucose-6-phosphate isomerase|uniref:Glucose-6-phosphate isomerase n=2 Tax=Thermosporothrix TaxID=768650 RepID=A0A326UD79_THEHA|nr:glucose-6-phosphate isomerase [Thermosporothrix hazakensis]PZW36428.1 transaldolase/glucose-6-phosphate isomerase [Thermosporothrix hazakensis]BBH88895.1 hypothetical protein KTC_36460 [Thermosporothrix sp. COM3]GCE47080.1 hypothetical protein KTH_19490 [Thermosporothrix hazakensis]
MSTALQVGQFQAPADLQRSVAEGWRVLDEQQVAARISQIDASLWKSDPAIQEKIRNRLGWLTVVNTMREKYDEIATLVDAVRKDGYKSAILLGMGGSSLCPEVLRTTFGVVPGYLELYVLDTTDPDTVHTVEQKIDLRTSLFIVASKSGGTIETMSHYKYFFDRVSKEVGADEAGKHFIAITDPGTSLETLGREQNFRHVFLNPPDIGGRYSALSFFGLVPGALIGLNIPRLLEWGEKAMNASQKSSAQENPGLWLGGIMGALYKQQRDKVTFIISPELRSFGYWVEQLIAESTGKEGRGLLPVEGEQLGTPDVYGNDRIFAYLRVDGGDNSELDKGVQALVDAGQPVVRFEIGDLYQIGAEFFRWEYATVVSGFFLDINPLDEPNVQESKDNTKRILTQYQQEHRLPEPTPVVVTNEPAKIEIVGKENGGKDLAGYLHNFLAQVRPGDYIAIMAYVERTESTEAALQALRTHLRDTYKVATTVGYGPRFLHSTGQLHKGGANNGVFIQITGDVHQDASIPGEIYSFAVLKESQALGDLYSLDNHERRNIRIHVSGDLAKGLQVVDQAI